MTKIIELLLRNYYFSDIHMYIKKYISTCDLYSQDKISWHPKYDEFVSLFVFVDSWKDIIYDKEMIECLKILYEDFSELIKVIQNQ